MPSLSEICEVEVLKDYTAQPYLSFDDLSSEFEESAVSAPAQDETASDENEQAELTQEPADTETSPAAAEEEQVTDIAAEEAEADEDRSSLPLYIIIIFGVVLMIVIYFFVFKKKA